MDENTRRRRQENHAMATTLDTVLQAALSLSEPDRVQLVEAILDTLQPEDAAPLDDAWLAEIERRSKDLDAGLVQTVPWDVVKENARKRHFRHANTTPAS
jgi:putative addiction module component (TIGR02574 family)